MPITKARNTQNVQALTVEWTYADITTAGGAQTIAHLPANSEITGGLLTVDTASNDTGTTVQFDVGISGTAEKYFSNANAKATGDTALVDQNGGMITAPVDVIIAMTGGNDDATAGAFRLRLEYIVYGKSNENQAGIGTTWRS